LHSILIQSEINTREALIVELWECGTAGIIENPGTVQAFFESEATLSLAVAQLSCPVLDIGHEPNRDGLPDACQARDPIYAGKRFFIVSSGMDDPTPPGRIRLIIEAVDAFGSGSHESTQIVIEVLEDYLPPHVAVLDVGCGSGILSAVVQKLGASQVFGCDTHTGALQCARMHSPESHFFGGSVDALAPAIADVVIVNIGASIIDLLTDELYRVIRPNGLLLLAGFTKDRTPARVRPERVFQLGDWLCWLCRPEHIDLSHQPQGALQPFPAQWW
jgi:ribosomal protein L11 methyltransferase